MPEPQRRLNWRVVASAVVLLLLLGMILPATLRGEEGTRIPVNTPGRRFCQVLLWVDVLVVPSSAPDAVRLPVNVATCALWGLAFGVPLGMVFRRRTER